VSMLPPTFQTLAASDLADQVEAIRITPVAMPVEELSKLWSAIQSHYRPSAAYQVSVVLIQVEEPAPSPLPVLTRNVGVLPNLSPTVPTLSAVVPAGKQNVVEFDAAVTLEGFSLDGTSREVVLANDRFQIEQTLPAAGSATTLQFTIPAARAVDFPAGIYRVHARVQKPAEPEPRATNDLALTIAPTIGGLPMSVARVGGKATFTLNFVPTARTGQSVRLMLGGGDFAPQPFTADTSSLSFEIPDAPVGDHLARLRIDGIDSPIIDPAATPPAFLDRRIQIT